ncbi:MAG: Holliday junction branch migration protein RuvA [Bacteroidetes bacterium]|jgi:Holliday junction DNA helicase RuvA|nr:Holliday junction branch migration protein RuvA [Bacteroidota bacterium]
MIAFVRGNFVNKSPAKVIVDVNGVGYDLHISLNTYEAISQQENGLLYTYLHITENAQTLFGFADVKEKEIFLHLISISGVGATTARIMLSNMKPSEIAKFIVSGSVNDLMRIKGIGKKTAELLVIGLRDKLSSFLTEQITTSNNYTLNPMEQDAVDALIALGINKPLAEKAVNKVLQTNTNIAVQDIIKLALKNL